MMDVQAVLQELEALATEQTKKSYRNRGVREPFFGVPTGAMKPLFKKIGRNHDLSMALYATGNYDAAYFAGMIAEPKRMTPKDFDIWMETAYSPMLSDYVVAVTLAETDFAADKADEWIESGKELFISAGYSGYCWLLGTRPDPWFDGARVKKLLEQAERNFAASSPCVQNAMNEFIAAVGVSYLPLHEEALKTADRIYAALVKSGGKAPSAAEQIRKAAAKGRLGFKRRNVRC